MGSFYPTDITRRTEREREKGTIFFVLSTDNGRVEEKKRSVRYTLRHIYIFFLVARHTTADLIGSRKREMSICSIEKSICSFIY